MTLLFVCISRPFLCHTAFFVLMFFLKRKTVHGSRYDPNGGITKKEGILLRHLLL